MTSSKGIPCSQQVCPCQMLLPINLSLHFFTKQKSPSKLLAGLWCVGLSGFSQTCHKFTSWKSEIESGWRVWTKSQAWRHRKAGTMDLQSLGRRKPNPAHQESFTLKSGYVSAHISWSLQSKPSSAQMRLMRPSTQKRFRCLPFAMSVQHIRLGVIKFDVLCGFLL